MDRTRHGWSPEDLATLRTMWARGRTSYEISAALEGRATRNAVMGKVNRLGLMGLSHVDDARTAAMGKVADLMGEEFHLGSPLHLEALLVLRLVAGDCPRTARDLALSTGVAVADCERVLSRLPRVWRARDAAPDRWAGGLEGNLALVLDLAYLAGTLDEPAERGRTALSPPTADRGPRMFFRSPASDAHVGRMANA